MMQQMLADVYDATTEVRQVTERLEYYIQDTTVPLDSRWEVFSTTPSYFKNNEHWMPGFEGTVLEDISWYDEFGVEKYRTLSSVEFVDEWLADRMKADEEDIKWYKDTGKVVPTEEDLVAIKEYILKNNIGTMTYDW